MQEVFWAIGIVAILLIILIVLVSSTVRRVNVLVKNIFIDKLQEYDYLIDDKEKKIDTLNEDISKKKKTFIKLEQEMKGLKVNEEEKEEESVDEVILPTDADFEDGNILSGYKKIKEGFRFDTEQVIKDFIKDKVKDTKKYEIYIKVKSYFNYNTLYKILMYQPDEQKIILNELLSDEEKKELKSLLEIKKFDINRFLSKIDNLILKNDPEIQVIVGEKDKNYNHLNKYINTIYDEKITEGFKIVYQGRVYDYSI